MQRCSPSITEFQINWFHDHCNVCWDLLLFHDQLCENKEEPTDSSLKKLTTRKKTLFLTFAFPNLRFLLEDFLPDALDMQPLPPKENVSKEKCHSVCLAWSHQTEWGDIQGGHCIKGQFCCMWTKERSKEQVGCSERLHKAGFAEPCMQKHSTGVLTGAKPDPGTSSVLLL